MGVISRNKKSEQAPHLFNYPRILINKIKCNSIKISLKEVNRLNFKIQVFTNVSTIMYINSTINGLFTYR